MLAAKTETAKNLPRTFFDVESSLTLASRLLSVLSECQITRLVVGQLVYRLMALICMFFATDLFGEFTRTLLPVRSGNC